MSLFQDSSRDADIRSRLVGTVGEREWEELRVALKNTLYSI